MVTASKFLPCDLRRTIYRESSGEDQDVPYMSYEYETTAELVLDNFGKGPSRALAAVVEALVPLYIHADVVMWYTIVLSANDDDQQTGVRVSVATSESEESCTLARSFQHEIDRLLAHV